VSVILDVPQRANVVRGRGAVLGFGIPLAMILLVAMLADLLPLPDPNLQDLSASLLAPGVSPDHLLGTDQLGRDMLSRLVYGARLSLLIGVIGMVLGAIVGTALGLVAGYYRGAVDIVVSRLIDAQLAIPFVLLAIALITSNGRSLTILIVVLALFSWAQYARVVRAETLALRERPFVHGLRTGGLSGAGIVLRHLLPNQAGTVLVLATLQMGAVMLAEGALSFLGLGVVSPDISWGAMLSEGKDQIVYAWWIAALPGLAIFITVLLVNLLGDALRSVLDPRRRRY
jgi:peptide/nickel transport system permease protein